MGDPDRGYAFTRAVLGLPALELHLCGDPSMVPLVERIAHELGDNLTVNHYKRQGPEGRGPGLPVPPQLRPCTLKTSSLYLNAAYRQRLR